MSLAREDIERIVGLNVPVLCLDTCTVLDIMRDPTRDTSTVARSKSAIRLLEAVEVESSVSLLIGEQVHREFDNHADRIEAEAETLIGAFRKRIQRVSDIAAQYTQAPALVLTHLEGHAERARAVVDRYMAAGTRVPVEEGFYARAGRRVHDARAPARLGKDSMMDCLVIETYLDVARALRDAGLTSSIVFASSNTQDYRDANTSDLRADLEAEFAPLGMRYAQDLSVAMYQLGVRFPDRGGA
ncbi:hypothetical protein SAMN05216345_107358 [Cupriavidus sp. YR651]|uniref:PIN domain-containing protein n=1 Tax=Cupriavidus sp. YR651 TaxID=1855315 RepID=UPI000883A14B|nr:PIN domain-containing protein [Cupriavidus sp. YR651]SDD30403.1 hypothetical protein SAMN05216345_107358 [Cupriavidus sp. YR651]